MKAKIIPFTGILVGLLLISDSCEETVYKIFTGNAPVYMSYDELRSSITTQQNVDLEDPGRSTSRITIFLLLTSRKEYMFSIIPILLSQQRKHLLRSPVWLISQYREIFCMPTATLIW